MGAQSLVAAIKTIAWRKKKHHRRICHMHAKRTRGLTRSHAARAARSSVPSSFTRCEEKKAKKKTRRYYSGQHYASKPKQKQHEKTSKRTRGKENPTLLLPIQPTAFIIEAFQSESALASNEPILLRLGSTHPQHPPAPRPLNSSKQQLLQEANQNARSCDKGRVCELEFGWS